MRARMAQAHRQLLRMSAPEPAGARFRHLPPVIDIVLFEKAGRPVIGLAPDADRTLQLMGGIPVNEYEVPEFGLERASRQSEPQPQNPIREDRVVAELHPVRSQCPEPPLNLISPSA